MRNKIFFLVFGVLIVGSALFVSRSYLRDFVFAQTKTTRVQIKNTVLQAEVAQTEAQRETGLSGRATLGMDKAMLFVYSKPTTPVFWMEGMRFPLDIIFISKGKIVEIVKEAMPPMPEQVRETYSPPEPVDWVLEVNAGLSDRQAWKVGDTLTLHPLPPTSAEATAGR